MSELQTGIAHADLEPSLQESPLLKTHKSLPRWRDDIYTGEFVVASSIGAPELDEDEILSQASSQHRASLASHSALSGGADSGLPPTPPSNSGDQTPPASFSPPPHANSVVSTLLSKKSSLSTPVNQRSPPTPDPSPPRTTESMAVSERPAMFAYPSSRAESFRTAREDPYSTDVSPIITPTLDRLSTVVEDRNLALAFDPQDDDVTPTEHTPKVRGASRDVETEQQLEQPLDVDEIPNREWDTNLMRNVTVHRPGKRRAKPKKKSPEKENIVPAPTDTTPRRASSLRERVEASKNSPHTPSMEQFAESIGWPSEVNSKLNDHMRDTGDKRHSGSSFNSTVVEAMVIVTPPQRKRTLRHTGKNLAYRRVASADVSASHSNASYSNRNSLNSEEVPLNRLVHKRSPIPEKRHSMSKEPDSAQDDDSPPYIRKRRPEYVPISALHRNMQKLALQPAAEITGFPQTGNSSSKTYPKGRSFHKRVASAPEPQPRVFTREPRTFLEFTPPESPKKSEHAVRRVPKIEQTSPSTPGMDTRETFVKSPQTHEQYQVSAGPDSPFDLNKSLPHLPIQSRDGLAERTSPAKQENKVKLQPAPIIGREEQERESRKSQEQHRSEPRKYERRRTSSGETVPTIGRSSFSGRGRSEERHRNSNSQDRLSTSRDTIRQDLTPSEELPRHSHEWSLLRPEDHRRVSFDRSTVRTEEHAMARHLYAQSTPFSQFSDVTGDGLEVSEATAVSIYPHNNHSLLVVQQVARSDSLNRQRLVANEPHVSSSDVPSSPPAVVKTHPEHQQPTLTLEPSTPPTKNTEPVAVDSPLKNPRKPPEPPVIKFIPPTPAEELDKQLIPGPPPKSEGHPVRRLSLVQRARRYSDHLITPLLARASSTRSRTQSESHHDHPLVPNVNEVDGTLHPFWRPRGFWEGFEDDSDSDDDYESGRARDGTTVVVKVPAAPRMGLSVLGRRLTNSFKRPEGFLIGNSLSIERSGTNKRRPHIELPARKARRTQSPRSRSTPPPRSQSRSRSRSDSPRPKIIIQPPTIPIGFRTRSPGIERRRSNTSMRSTGSGYDRGRVAKRESWRKGKTIPGLKMQVQYIGLSGMKERLRERRAEKRRDVIRRSIGEKYFEDKDVGLQGGSVSGSGSGVEEQDTVLEQKSNFLTVPSV